MIERSNAQVNEWHIELNLWSSWLEDEWSIECVTIWMKKWLVYDKSESDRYLVSEINSVSGKKWMDRWLNEWINQRIKEWMPFYKEYLVCDIYLHSDDK